MITTTIIYEKLTDLELSILETIQNELIDLNEKLDYYEKGSEEYHSIIFQYKVIDNLYIAILEDFENHGKAVEEAS